MPVLAYVDESGCTGMRLNDGASAFYAVTAVLFEDREVADECYRLIDRLRDEWRVAKEFHFSKLRHDLRVRFFQEVSRLPFQYVSLCFDKKRILEQGTVITTPFLHFQVKAIFEVLAPKMSSSTVVIDKSGSSDFRKALAKQLKQALNSSFDREVIKKVKEQHSHTHCLLQLADMVCGAVARSFYPAKKNQGAYREIIAHRELTVVLWPPSA